MRSILLFFFLAFGCDLQAQGSGTLKEKDLSLLRSFSILPVERMAIPSPWNYQRMGVFCKLDVQLERRMRFPVLFRLGDVRQVEAWEGKGPLRALDLR